MKTGRILMRCKIPIHHRSAANAWCDGEGEERDTYRGEKLWYAMIVLEVPIVIVRLNTEGGRECGYVEERERPMSSNDFSVSY